MKKVALVLSSGGPRGFAYVGAIEELVRRGYVISSVTGASAGSLVGGVYAAGGLEAFKEWITCLTPAQVMTLMDPAFSRTALVKGERLMREIRKRVPEVEIEDLPIPFTAVATDLYTGEEVLFRGIVFRMIDDRWGTVVALVVSALIFGFVHITNNNATVWSSVAIAVEAGLLLGAAYKWSGTLWVPIGIHWSWNYFQGPVFGFAVSGNGTPSLITPVIQGSDWLTGGSFGAEASIPAFVLGLALAIVFLLLPRRTACTSR